MIFLLMAIDGLSPPIGLASVTAHANGTQLVMEGRYQAGLATPILVWPRTLEPWVNPCKGATDLCCLKTVATKYRNDALSSVQGPACLKSLPPNLVSGSRPNVLSTTESFHTVVPLATPWVAVLFVHASPFFVLDSYQAFQSEAGGSVETSLVIAHNPCYSVVVPGTLASVCMQCNNPLPSNARYVWTQTWYTDYVCEWQCEPDYVRNDNACESAARRIPLMGVIGGACAAVVVILIIIYCSLRRAYVPPPDAHHDVEVPKLRSDMIQFKDGNPLIPLRIKRS